VAPAPAPFNPRNPILLFLWLLVREFQLGFFVKVALLLSVMSSDSGLERAKTMALTLSLLYVIHVTRLLYLELVARKEAAKAAREAEKRATEQAAAAATGATVPVPDETAAAVEKALQESLIKKPGILGEIELFFTGLVISIFPGWEPPVRPAMLATEIAAKAKAEVAAKAEEAAKAQAAKAAGEAPGPGATTAEETTTAEATTAETASEKREEEKQVAAKHTPREEESAVIGATEIVAEAKSESAETKSKGATETKGEGVERTAAGRAAAAAAAARLQQQQQQQQKQEDVQDKKAD
jgi:hypothetical protein